MLLMASCGGSIGTGPATGNDSNDLPLGELPIGDRLEDDSGDSAGVDLVPELPCTPDCTTAGDRQCAIGVQGFFQVCTLGVDGCLKWAAAEDCGTGKACDAGQCLDVCLSDPGCTKTGDKRCGSAAAFQECIEAAAGCYKFGVENSCPEAQTCVGDGNCECQHSCPTITDRRCFGDEPNLYQSCIENPAGCRVWGATVACEGDAVCKGAGVCEEVCVSDCPTEGDMQCASGTAYQICQTRQPGCLKWGDAVACPGVLTCDAGECKVDCVSDPECTAPDATGCSPNGLLRTCQEVASGCFKLGIATDCPLHQTCTGSACVCESPCLDGAAECSVADTQFRKVCLVDDASCSYWEYQDCGGGANCKVDVCVDICSSSPGCSDAGVTRCESRDSFATCEQVVADPVCIQFGDAVACQAHQECQELSGACACRVEAGCTQADLKRCIDYDNASTCLKDTNDCLYWGVPEPCPDGNTCNDGVCGPLCVSDLDCPAIGTNRCSPEGLLQTCVEVPGVANCIKWAPSQSCPANQVCVGAKGCECDNPCVAGQNRCVGLSQRQVCAAPDPLGCTTWSDAQQCLDGDSCVQGECRKVVSPSVDCGKVTLRLVNEGWSQVEVRGNFVGPSSVSTPAVLTDGVWTATVNVTLAGTYEYKFVADGTWVTDPLNPDKVPPLDYSAVTVEFIKTCDTIDAGRCTTEGALETCQENSGCWAWLPAANPCTDANQYCDTGVCYTIISPEVTPTSVTFTVRDQGYQVSVAGNYTNPAYEIFQVLTPLTGHRTATVQGLTPGQYTYKFRVDTTQTWFFDPSNPDKEVDPVEGFRSLFTIPAPAR
jgi:hypothetical protein